jgi:CoA:oxalate CoA-transferase
METSYVSAPLEGVRVIDITHVIAGPLCTQLLADAGATVIKVEPPGGEWARKYGHLTSTGATVMPYFTAYNRSKMSITIDLHSEAGLSTIKRLIGASDVVVQNYLPGTLPKLGLDLESSRAENPRLIVVSISLFGDSPFSQTLGRRGGHNDVAEAESGLLALTDPANPPAPRNVGDSSTGISAFGAVCAALYERERTGRGRHIGVSMVATAGLFNASGVVRAQVDLDRGSSSGYAGIGMFQAADGYVALGVNTDKLWERLVTAIGRTDLASNPRFSTNDARNARRDEANSELTSWTSQHTREEIVKVVGPTGVPCGAVRTTQEVVADPQSRELGIVFDADDGFGGTIATMGNPWGFVPVLPGIPKCGEHTEQVVRNVLDLDDATIAELAQAGAFGGQ